MRRGRIVILIWTFFACLAALPLAGARVSLGKDRTFRLRFTVTVRNHGAQAQDVRVNLPVVAERDLPVYERVQTRALDPPSIRLTIDGHGLATAKLGSISAGKQAQFKLDYRIRVCPVTYRLPWLPRRSWAELPAGLNAYLRPAEGIEAQGEEIVRFAQANVGKNADPVFQAKALYAATNRLLTYDAQAGQESALATLRAKRANCEGYARLYAALCRAVGIPARLVFGLRLQDEDLAVGEFDADATRHVWDEIYLAGLGWVPADPTFTYTVDGEKGVSYRYFGRLNEGDLHLLIGRGEQKVSWTYRVPPGHPGLEVEHHLLLEKVAP